MKYLVCLSSVFALFLFGFNSCKKAEVITQTDEISQQTRDRIFALGFTSDGATREDGGYIVEGDIFLTDEDLNAPAANVQMLVVGQSEQYRTTNLVNAPRVIDVYINTGSGGGTLPTSYGAALDVAIARYNAENLSLTFNRVFSSSAADISIIKGNGNYLASAGFPSGGNPYGTVKVNSNAIGNGSGTTFSNYVGTIIAHEMGHCIGFRHTDYMDRSYSCGGAYSNEGASNVGAINIPGTPTGPDANSWMLACIGSNQSRPFNNNDKTALNYLY